MFELKRPLLEDKDILDSYLKYNKYRSCELSAANNILWAEYFDTYYAVIEDMLVYCKVENEKVVCTSFPIGKNNHRRAFDVIKEYFENNNLQFKMYLVSEVMYKQIDEWYPNEFEVHYDRDDADYLYSREMLATLSGKKLHGKRNHINRFVENNPDYKYQIIDEDNIKECIEMSNAWAIANDIANRSDIRHENDALQYALNNMKKLGLEGALIRVDGTVIAFTVGEQLTDDTFVVHFEKAYSDVQGAYTMINREFVRNNMQRYKYVNREEDMGIEGLRKAKLSYAPLEIIEKGVVTRR